MGPLSCFGVIALGCFFLSGCCPNESEPLPELPANANASPLSAANDDTVVVEDLFGSVGECDVYHRGVLLDLGSPAMQGRYGYDIFPSAGVRDVVREGASWASVEVSTISISFFQLESEPVFVQTRIRGIGSGQATVRIDGKVVGGARFKRNAIEVISTATTEAPLPTGVHTLSYHFHLAKRDLPKAEIDWVRIGIPDSDPTTFGAPTLRDLAVDATVDGRPHKSLALRGPGRVRCAFAAREDMRLQTKVGYTGPGEGEAQIQLVEPGKPAYLLHASKLGGEREKAEIVELPLEGHAGQIVALELIASKTSPGGRILFGDPSLRVRRPDVPARPKAKVVVVLVLTGANPNHLPPYEGRPNMPTMTKLGEESVTFMQHRAPTTVVAGSVASLLTGLSPAAHKVSDTGARLSTRIPTIGTTARDGRVATSMFTGNPSTFEAFGFSRGWDRYAAYTPVSGTSARAPLRDATEWVDERLEKDEDRPLLVVVHARGGHPPWAVTAEQVKKLPPKDYAGDLNSRRGGQILAKERFRRHGRPKLSAEDRVRIGAFAALALTEEDAMLNKLIQVLQEHEVWNSTMLIVTSDIAMGDGSRVPYGDGESLGEDLLHIPLMIRFPEHRFGGSRVQAPTSTTDIARTVLATMGLDPADPIPGRDLLEVAAHPGRFGTVPQFAFGDGTYATRWGGWLLSGKSPSKPKFCELDAAPICLEDITEENPFFASWMWRMTYRKIRASEGALLPVASREPATLDPDTVAALTVWGSLPPKSD